MIVFSVYAVESRSLVGSESLAESTSLVESIYLVGSMGQSIHPFVPASTVRYVTTGNVTRSLCLVPRPFS